MRGRRVLIFIVLILTFASGCSKEGTNLRGSEVPDSAPFAFDRDNIVKVTISRGDGQLAFELTDNKNLNRVRDMLNKSRSFTGAYPFDLLAILVIESKNGTKRELQVTGNGHVFVDMEAKIAYELNNKKFFDFVEELKYKSLDGSSTITSRADPTVK